ncbi:type II toxin-antitoxin system RelE/ParE family toxin [Methylomonas sp. MS20]|uniref:type II toxin-antitoxin system RelE/ParE family toxin n=1 Tax=unclassified Methylomonas TaxID=2608980 RepID=UPI0028A530D8|nr:type II toxin-antitoxin system RelE/ParE family toxin [Methylomonas sp. MV1]MDT4331076.1 type II toxin-antitoxin system RelE/ParE family toxin [Methylomonas sp. MV1]
MKLKVLHHDKFKIAATMNGTECEVEAFFEESISNSNYEASAEGLFVLIERIAKDGLDGLSPHVWHLVDKDNKIYELIKGDLRLLFFKGPGDLLVIASHGFIKKTQKTPDNEKNKAIRRKKQYQKDCDACNIELVDE